VGVEINAGDGEKVAKGFDEGGIEGLAEGFMEGTEIFSTTKNAIINITASKITTIPALLLPLKTCILIQEQSELSKIY
jgi:hypothetical protein